MLIAIITARKGSKRLVNKNIRIIKKKPLYYWAIKILKKARIFKKIIISTDHPSIIKNARKYGADLILKRKKKLANDKSTTLDVIKDNIHELEKQKIKFKFVCCMYPTGVLTNYKDLKKTFKTLKKNNNKFIFPVYPLNNRISIIKDKYQKINNIKKIKKLNNAYFIINQFYVDSGQYYFSSKKNWIKKNKIIDKNNIILIKKKTELRDINTIKDLNHVRRMFQKNYEILQ